ncbi:MAG: hypothetical protein AAF655_25430 [Bacteroidota bacterium]
MSIETLIQAYHNLSDSDRAYFLSQVLVEEDMLTPAWQEEISRRWNNLQKGHGSEINGHEVERKIAGKYGFKL